MLVYAFSSAPPPSESDDSFMQPIAAEVPGSSGNRDARAVATAFNTITDKQGGDDKVDKPAHEAMRQECIRGTGLAEQAAQAGISRVPPAMAA